MIRVNKMLTTQFIMKLFRTNDLISENVKIKMLDKNEFLIEITLDDHIIKYKRSRQWIIQLIKENKDNNLLKFYPKNEE